MRQSSKAGGWIAGTAFLAILIFVAAWFFAISPLLSQAGETRDQADAQLAQNVITQTKINRLKDQFEHKDELVTELAALREQVPTSADLANYRRQIDALAVAHGVTVVSVNTGTASSLAPVAPPPAETEDAAGEGETADAAAADATADGAADTAATPAAPAANSPFGVPVAIDVVGTYDAVVAFLADLQLTAKRLMVIEQLSGTSLEAAEATGGKPKTAAGDLELIITGQVFVLPEQKVATPPAEGDPATPVPLPPANGRNPLVTNG